MMKNQEIATVVVVLLILIIMEEIAVKTSMTTMNHQRTIILISTIIAKQQRDLVIKIEIKVMIDMVVIMIVIGTMTVTVTKEVVQVQESMIRMSLLLDPQEKLLAQTPFQAEEIHMVTPTVVVVIQHHTAILIHMAMEAVDNMAIQEVMDRVLTAIKIDQVMEEVTDLIENLKSVAAMLNR